MNSCLQVTFYLAELTEKVVQDDRIQILKASQAKLKVNTLHYLKNSLKLCYGKKVVMLLLTLIERAALLGIHIFL